jgi:hypothetical protein
LSIRGKSQAGAQAGALDAYVGHGVGADVDAIPQLVEQIRHRMERNQP